MRLRDEALAPGSRACRVSLGKHCRLRQMLVGQGMAMPARSRKSLAAPIARVAWPTAIYGHVNYLSYIDQGHDGKHDPVADHAPWHAQCSCFSDVHTAPLRAFALLCPMQGLTHMVKDVHSVVGGSVECVSVLCLDCGRVVAAAVERRVQRQRTGVVLMWRSRDTAGESSSCDERQKKSACGQAGYSEGTCCFTLCGMCFGWSCGLLCC